MIFYHDNGNTTNTITITRFFAAPPPNTTEYQIPDISGKILDLSGKIPDTSGILPYLVIYHDIATISYRTCRVAHI